MLPPPPTWTRIGQYALAVAAGAAGWIAHAADRLSSPLAPATEDLVGALLVVDLLLGAAMLALLPLRLRHPLAVACVSTAVAVFSASSVGATAIAVGAMATRRRREWAALVAAVAVAAGITAELVGPGFSPGTIVLLLAFVVVCLATGSYLGVRRDLVVSLHERAMTAEREQALAAGAARDAERTRIAREMHDVLAHRISLVALHAGALTYRGDLTRTETVGTAEIIQSNAQLALAELREVLGVLRAGDAAAVDSLVEPPQPTLAELPALLADAREAGSEVRLNSDVVMQDLPETLSRTAFRIVQEALTNARRHAPGAPVTVRLAHPRAAGAGPPAATGRRGHLELEVSNRAPATPAPRVAPPGVGLAGLAERAEMAGGTLTAGQRPDGMFLVKARLPWPA
ncbi:sensor histidine kinase [Amorphoplanes digitatis]|uniref:histidine kinase n=1 Tax=Actinoplanes digitatis TaxID=1868 RepID=A0A7W7I624_9ACTN|nr:histidine kinase [Actinoplanes digitatis]MBB4767085.1 signal transduction histidine kinase [Actinoplanes digitatis]GID95549.1 two-component sensor histidine kinase [Actinoplanes digitatis]